MSDREQDSEAMLDRAFEIADRHFSAALDDDASMAAFVAIAMIEVSANAAVEAIGAQDAAALLRDLAEQIESDGGGDEAEDS